MIPYQDLLLSFVLWASITHIITTLTSALRFQALRIPRVGVMAFLALQEWSF